LPIDILIVKEERITTLEIINDSMVVIKPMLVKMTPTDFKLASIIARARKETNSFEEISFYHVKRGLRHNKKSLG
jgi:hypothetical protein